MAIQNGCQIQQFVEYCKEHLCFKVPKPTGYQSAPLCALDAVFSQHVDYKVVENIMKRIGNNLIHEDPIKSTIRTSKMIGLIDSIPKDKLTNKSEYFTANCISDKAKTLKVDVYRNVLNVMKNHDVETCDDIHEREKDEAFIKDMLGVNGIGDVLLAYIFNLSGMEEFVKADRRIQKFVDKAINGYHSNKRNEYVEIIRKAAKYMAASGHTEMTPRYLDHIIWKCYNVTWN